MNKKYVPILILFALMAAAYFSGIHDSLTYENLRDNHQTLERLVSEHPFLAPLLFMVVYTATTALSLPGGIFLSIFGGFLFPQPWSTIYVVIAATMGSIIIFLAARTAFGNYLKEKAGPRLQKMRKGFEEDAANYLLFLRLVPLFPFWLVNLAPAFFKVSLWTFTWTTFIGIIPGSFVFTQAGVGLGSILKSGDTLSFESIFNIQVRIALLSLAFFVLLPVVIKKIKNRGANKP